MGLKTGLTLDDIEASLSLGEARRDEIVADLEPHRVRLAQGLRQQRHAGGVHRRHLAAAGVAPEHCEAAHKLEWRLKGKDQLYPGMPSEARRTVVESTRHARHIKPYTNLWRAAEHLLSQPNENAVSGRLYLTEERSKHGVSRVVRTRGIKPIAEQWAHKPTLIMDATPPELSILQVLYPQAQVTADIQAATPHVTMRQVIGAPVARKKLFKGGAERNLHALRRYVLLRWLEVGREPTLVVAQKEVAEWLKTSGLHCDIAVEWFNNVSGLDEYKHARLLVVIGRTQPGPSEIETRAGALTGLEPKTASVKANGSPWFDKVARGIRLKDGSGHAVDCDVHPDPIAEAIRWQICEAELMQAIGRGRGVNRTADTPLDVDILADVCLPVTVAAVLPWATLAPNAGLEMLVEGVCLHSASDLAKCFPEIWPTSEASRDWLKPRNQPTTGENPFEYILTREFPACGRYQLPGARQKWRTFRYAPGVLSNPRAWLEARLGPLARFELTPLVSRRA